MLRGAGDASAAFELRKTHLLLQHVTPQLGDLRGKERAGGRRGVALGLERRDGLGCLGCEVLASGLEGGDGARFEIRDAGTGCI